MIRDNFNNLLKENNQQIHDNERILEDYEEVHSYLSEKWKKFETGVLKGLQKAFEIKGKLMMKNWWNQIHKFKDDEKRFIKVIIASFS